MTEEQLTGGCLEAGGGAKMSLGVRKGPREGETTSIVLGRWAPGRALEDCRTGFLPTRSCNHARSPLVVTVKKLTVAKWLRVLIFHPLEKDCTSPFFAM